MQWTSAPFILNCSHGVQKLKICFTIMALTTPSSYGSIEATHASRMLCEFAHAASMAVATSLLLAGSTIYPFLPGMTYSARSPASLTITGLPQAMTGGQGEQGGLSGQGGLRRSRILVAGNGSRGFSVP